MNNNAKKTYIISSSPHTHTILTPKSSYRDCYIMRSILIKRDLQPA